MFKKILIANRGEIAVRILRACQELGIATVAIHSTADSEAMHVRLADESVCIGQEPALKSYLNMTAVLAAAEITNADAIHPGYGFLSENAHFASMTQEHGITFIGPSADHIALMGNKMQAKQKAKELGLPVVDGSPEEIDSLDSALELAECIGYPILLKAVNGGGGKGMRVVRQKEHLKHHLESAKSEAFANFGSQAIYMEKFFTQPRHIETQIIADHYGQVVCLGERDCSIQRRHQKIWEEALCPVLSDQERQLLMETSRKAMQNLGYHNVGTLEFLYEDGQFYFMEMNTRLQVEHPVTEMITNVDIVKEQIQIAAGCPLSMGQEDVQFKGHAIECRINAEHPLTFAPSPGVVHAYLPPGGPFVRVDSALFSGCHIPPFYDSLIAKLIVYGQNRRECLARLRRALGEYVITGIDTLIPLHKQLCMLDSIKEGRYHVKWLENEFLVQEQVV